CVRGCRRRNARHASSLPAPTAETSSRSPAGVALGASPSPVRWSSTTDSGGAERAGQLGAGRSAQNGGGSLLSSPVCQYVSALDRGGRVAQGPRSEERRVGKERRGRAGGRLLQTN